MIYYGLLFLVTCRQNRQTCQKITDWAHHHKDYVKMWRERRYRKERDMAMVDWDEYEETHLKWFDDGMKYCLRLRPKWTAADITSLEADNPEEEAYNANLRRTQGDFREYAPLLNRVVSCVELLEDDICR